MASGSAIASFITQGQDSEEIAAAAAALAVGLSSASPAVVAQQNAAIGTGGVTGVYYAAGSAICRLLNKER